MSTTRAAKLHGEFEGLVGLASRPSAKAAQSQFWLPLALFASTTLLPIRAMADDECAAPTIQVKALVTALNKAMAGNPGQGHFVVKRLSSRDEAGRFEVAYVVGGKPVFSRRLEQQPAVSEHFAASTSRKPSGVLEVGYAFGAGGQISCEYAIGRAPVEFVARRK